MTRLGDDGWNDGAAANYRNTYGADPCTCRSLAAATRYALNQTMPARHVTATGEEIRWERVMDCDYCDEPGAVAYELSGSRGYFHPKCVAEMTEQGSCSGDDGEPFEPIRVAGEA